jgi:hypothetical protein
MSSVMKEVGDGYRAVADQVDHSLHLQRNLTRVVGVVVVVVGWCELFAGIAGRR